jgi:hypothetical protein
MSNQIPKGYSHRSNGTATRQLICCSGLHFPSEAERMGVACSMSVDRCFEGDRTR